MLEVRAIRPIEAGEELCISYTDLDLTTADRRSVLQVQPPLASPLSRPGVFLLGCWSLGLLWLHLHVPALHRHHGCQRSGMWNCPPPPLPLLLRGLV